jgi:hypothetical protein
MLWGGAFDVQLPGLSGRWATAGSWSSATVGCDRGLGRSGGARRAAAALPAHAEPGALVL